MRHKWIPSSGDMRRLTVTLTLIKKLQVKTAEMGEIMIIIIIIIIIMMIIIMMN